jgi:hypothetical protein
MRHELFARLEKIIKGESISKNGVADVAGVAVVARYASKSPELRQLRPLRVENSNAGKAASGGVVERSQTDKDTILEERAGMAADSVPEVYLHAWAQLNCRRPAKVTEAAWRQALDDGGRFLDTWGSVAAEWQWSVGEIFDVPRAGSAGGLIWKIAGRAVEAFGPEFARFDDGEVFERMRGADR